MFEPLSRDEVDIMFGGCCFCDDGVPFDVAVVDVVVELVFNGSVDET